MADVEITEPARIALERRYQALRRELAAIQHARPEWRVQEDLSEVLFLLGAETAECKEPRR